MFRIGKDYIRAKSFVLLREMSRILNDLADELEKVVRDGEPLDVATLARIARELKVNHETLLTLSRVNNALGRKRIHLN